MKPISGSWRAARAITRWVALAAATFPFASCYLLNQGASLLRYQAAAEPVDGILERGSFADGSAVSGQTRAFLSEVERIRAFSADLGLAASRNYVSLVPTERDYLADVVNATAELSFERHEWWWPFVGRLPYKGFYQREGALRLADRLRRRGLDVWVRPVDAFSTLGVLRDPLYEFMVGYDRHTLANLIIHEQAHATLFLRGHAQFNEEFATFVGDTGADAYLRSVGADAEELSAIASRAADRDTAITLVLGLRGELEELYASSREPQQVREEKTRVIAAFQDRVRTDYDSIFRTDRFARLSEVPINNAYIDLYVSYTEDLDLFGELFSTLGNDLRRLLEVAGRLSDPRLIADPRLRRLARSDPKAYIRALLLDSSPGASVE